MENKKMSVKDLVNVGVFTVIYYVLFMISLMTGFIPVMAVFFPVLLALVGGIPCILFYTKVKSFGSVTVMGVLMGLAMFLMGYGFVPLLIGSGCGLVADLVMRAGGYRSFRTMLLGYVIFSLWVISAQIPMFLMGAAYAEMSRETQGDEYVEALAALLGRQMIPIVIAATVVAAIIGTYIGRAVLNKHFKRAGIV